MYNLLNVTNFLGAKSELFKIINGKSKKTLYSGADMAYNPPLSYKRVFAQICKGSAKMASVAF